MSPIVDFYLRRAAESAEAARETELVNVRERCLRAETVWRAMADRQLWVEENRRLGEQAKEAGTTGKPLDVPWPIAPTKPIKRPTKPGK